MHLIAFADDSSEGAVTTPEPATLCILGLGGLVLIRKRKVK
ncbi:MAG: PEP-CTERM sorting domain-containing protein [Planctomycetota bacterium]